MRVLLVIPTAQYGITFPALFSNTDFPAGFAYLASALGEAGHDVFGLNPNNEPDHASAQEMLRTKLSRSIGNYRPDLIGLGGLCTEYRFIRDAVRFCREFAPDIPIVCGGGIVTHDSMFIAETLRPDFCIIGEGEETIVRLAGMLESGDKGYAGVPNLGFLKDGRISFSERSFDFPHIDSRPFPDYEPFGIREMLDNYGLMARNSYRYTRTNPRPMTIVTARGCPFQCTFCVHQGGPVYRARSVPNIMRELEFMYDRYRFNILIVLDELFAANRNRLREFSEAVIARRNLLGWDFDWCFQTHASASLTVEDLKLARQAGCYYFSYGLESASPKVLASMNKKTNPSQIVEAISRAHETKIGFGGNLIFGDVAETAETILETLTFLKQHLLDDIVSLMPVQPYPGSKLFEDCIVRGIIRDKREYYEHTMYGAIFNMTSLPDALWFSLIQEIYNIAVPAKWVRPVAVNPLPAENGTNPCRIYAHAGKSVFRVLSRCPHCEETVENVELLDVHKNGRLRFLNWALDLYRNEKVSPIAFLRYRVLPFLKRKLLLSGFRRDHDVFRLVEDLTDRSQATHRSFATGCVRCNRQFRVKFDSWGSEVAP